MIVQTPKVWVRTFLAIVFAGNGARVKVGTFIGERLFFDIQTTLGELGDAGYDVWRETGLRVLRARRVGRFMNAS